MVKKKGKSKRTTLKDKYRIQKCTAETHRKRKKQAKRDAANGVVISKKKKDPGIPNSWPFKQDLLKEIRRTRERQQQLQQDAKEKRKEDLRALREHQEKGGTARTVKELLEQANRDRAAFEGLNGSDGQGQVERERSANTKAAGQQSRRAYFRELKKVVDMADVLLQVLDARDPIGSRIHPTVEDAIMARSDKRMVLVLNKIDLVPKEVVGAWLTTLRRSRPTIAIKASSERSTNDDNSTVATSSTAAVGMDGLLQLLKNYARTGGTGGKSKTAIVVGVIGYPNVGKSSIINALKRTRAVGVSPRPGFTTSMQEVVLDRNVRLLDSPGIVFDDRSALLGNCIDAESIDDPIPPVAALLKRCNHASLLMTYNIPAFPPGDVMVFLAMVARSYGRVLKGGIPDKVAAARAVLKDWNNGKIPYFTPPPRDAVPEVAEDAVILSEFGKEFDLAKFDQEVFGNLKETDEMDFVELDGEGDNCKAPRDVVQMLMEDCDEGEEDEEDEPDDMEEEEDDDEEEEEDAEEEAGITKGRGENLADAEDYDFEEM